MKIIDLKCAIIGKNSIVRVVTDEGISGFGEVEQYKPYLKPFILHFRDGLIRPDPTDVERCMMRICSARLVQALGGRRQRDRTYALMLPARPPACRSTSSLAAKCAIRFASLQRRYTNTLQDLHPRRLRRRRPAHEALAEEDAAFFD
jgi:hypothetical protein